MIKQCETCGKDFEAKRSTAKYCSDNCRVKAARGGHIIQTEDGPVKASDVIVLDSYEDRLAGFIKQGIEPVKFLKTGIYEWDDLIGGIPRGRVTEIYGKEGVGKSTLVLNLLKELKDERILYIDTEGAADPRHFTDMGLSPERLTFVQADMVEDIYDQVVANVGKYAAIIVDSVANCSFRTEKEGEAGDANMGVKAKIFNKLMRVVSGKLGNTALILVNQERLSMGGYVQEVYTPGGTGIKYAASLRVRLTTTLRQRFPKGGTVKDSERVAHLW